MRDLVIILIAKGVSNAFYLQTPFDVNYSDSQKHIPFEGALNISSLAGLAILGVLKLAPLKLKNSGLMPSNSFNFFATLR